MTNYQPARLRKGKNRWDITWYVDGERHRQTFGLNRIKDLKERELLAMQIVSEINSALRAGRLQQDPDREVNIVQAIYLALEIKFTEMKENSKRGYRSHAKVLIAWLHGKKLDHLNLSEFTRIHAMDFLDHEVRYSKISARTWNNKVIHYRSIWNELIARGYAKLNPWQDVRKKRETGKRRRAILEHERPLIFAAIMKENVWMGFAVMLLYFCFIRPAELGRLKVSMIDLDNGFVRLPGSITKNGRRANVTIPGTLLDWIEEHVHLADLPPHFYLFGSCCQPSRKKISANYLNKRHRKIVTRLEEAGKLNDGEGIQLYSWKDAGAINLFEQKVDLLQIKKQLRHTSLDVTQRYVESLSDYSPEIAGLAVQVPGD